ncbi:MAG: ferritin-like domain-containing protein [Gluconacetobacter diazotrophicus]|nr:ferritin-like domain-containing protein [Gluconacetobacter diazotrophicus]
MLDDTQIPNPEPVASGPSDADDSRRRLMRGVGVGLAGLAAGGLLASAKPAMAASVDVNIFNFALNFEYLGAEFYLRAVTGQGVSSYAGVTGVGTQGSVTGGGVVPFKTPAVAYFAQQLANDELAHVRFVRAALGSMAIAEPSINLSSSWTALAIAAGLINSTQTFNPFADEVSFLLGAYILEDVCVTALAGAASSLTNANDIAYAAGLLGAEAYQAGAIRGYLSDIGAGVATNAISALRAKLSGVGDNGTSTQGNPFTITNRDASAQAFRRTPAQVLNIAYGVAGTGHASGGFFPNGVNGVITST